MNTDYDPNSTNALFATIIVQLREQDKAAEVRERSIRERLDQQESAIRARLDQAELVSTQYRTDIREKLNEIKGETAEIKVETKKTNGRVTVIEGWIVTVKAKIAVVAVIASAICTALWPVVKAFIERAFK